MELKDRIVRESSLKSSNKVVRVEPIKLLLVELCPLAEDHNQVALVGKRQLSTSHKMLRRIVGGRKGSGAT